VSAFNHVPMTRTDGSLLDAAFACAVYVILLMLMIHISEEMRSAMVMMNISRPVIGTMLFMDTYSAVSVRIILQSPNQLM